MPRFDELDGGDSTPAPSALGGPDFVRRFLEQLEAMDSSGSFDWAMNTVQGIHESVEERGYVTEGQLRAINNIRARNKGGHDAWPEIEVY